LRLLLDFPGPLRRTNGMQDAGSTRPEITLQAFNASTDQSLFG
jgi:hypothetical protein